MHSHLGHHRRLARNSNCLQLILAKQVLQNLPHFGISLSQVRAAFKVATIHKLFKAGKFAFPVLPFFLHALRSIKALFSRVIKTNFRHTRAMAMAIASSSSSRPKKSFYSRKFMILPSLESTSLLPMSFESSTALSFWQSQSSPPSNWLINWFF